VLFVTDVFRTVVDDDLAWSLRDFAHERFQHARVRSEFSILDATAVRAAVEGDELTAVLSLNQIQEPFKRLRRSQLAAV